MWSGKVAVFHGPGQDIKIVIEDTPLPQPHQMVVKMVMAGICGSDVHRLDGDIATLPDPICFGHEAIGTILALGSEITTDSSGAPLAVDDLVYWNPVTPCQQCLECSMNNPVQCKSFNWPAKFGTPNAAGFREYATVDKQATYIKVPVGVSLKSIIAFGCAMPTAIFGLSKVGEITKDTDVVIQGSGPVGLATTLLSGIAGARSITVIGDPAHRLQIAKDLGATKTFSISQTTAETRLHQIVNDSKARGAGLVVEAAGAISAFPEGLDLLGMNGVYLILGLYSGQAKAPVNPVRINNYNQHIVGSLGISAAAYQRTVELAERYGLDRRLDDLVTHTYPLERLPQALEAVKKGIPVKAVMTSD